jgi:thiol-disulfide isomerase/thioredoxin
MKVIKFGAIWCNGCILMKPRWKEVEDENPWLETEYYDYDESLYEVKKYHIDNNLPVAIIVDGKGKELTRLNGETEKKVLVETIKKYKNQ